MAGPMPGLLTLMEELYGRINKERLFGGGVRGAATRGLLGAQPAEDMTPTQRDVYENAVRISAPAQGLTALKAATVFHGSPAKFKRFDPTKIGSGEGAQAYGYGHYVAESPGVAREYRDKLSKSVTVDGQKLTSIPSDSPTGQAHNMVVRAIQNGMTPQQAIAYTKKYWMDAADEMAAFKQSNPELAKRIDSEAASRREVAAATESMRPESFFKDPGSLYTIDLPDPAIARMLDWDKPLSQQPENVREALQKFGVADNQKKLSEFDDALLSALMGSGSTTLPKQPLSQTGESFYKTLGNPSAASQRLREAGIPGIRYLDQGSRSKFSVQNLYKGQPYGEPVSFMTELQAKEYAAEQVKKGFDTKMLPGTSNFVVFPGEEELLRILERNGVPITSLLDNAPQSQALETARKNAVKMLGLPESNTAMDRARAMGFNDKTYHGTFGRFENFDLSKANPRSQYMPGIFTADDPKLAENFGDYIMPLLQRKGTTVIDKRNARNAGLPLPEVDTIYDKVAGIRVTNKPENIRSRFAAFDPARIDEKDLLASLAAMGITLPLTMGLLSEQTD